MSVENLVGTKEDYLEIKGLQVGDIIKVYKKYGDLDGTEITFPALTITDIPNKRFPLPDLLAGEGGEIGVKVWRYSNPEAPEQGYNQTVDQVPVPYKAEPSKVYGYVSLSGKLAGSPLLEGITVQLTDGLSSPDPVTTDARGYFQFNSYIAPGTYTLMVSKDNYLKRTILKSSGGITISAGEEFAISTEANPIVLYPGDINKDGTINTADIELYVRNWVGLTDSTINRFAEFDFFDEADPVIDLFDLDMIPRHNGWVSQNYPTWTVPSSK